MYPRGTRAWPGGEGGGGGKSEERQRKKNKTPEQWVPRLERVVQLKRGQHRLDPPTPELQRIHFPLCAREIRLVERGVCRSVSRRSHVGVRTAVVEHWTSEECVTVGCVCAFWAYPSTYPGMTKTPWLGNRVLQSICKRSTQQVTRSTKHTLQKKHRLRQKPDAPEPVKFPHDHT